MGNATTVETLQEAIEITKEVIRKGLETNSNLRMGTPVRVWSDLKKMNDSEKLDGLTMLLDTFDKSVKPLLEDDYIEFDIEAKINNEKNVETLNVLKTLKKAHDLIEEYVFKQGSDKAVEVSGSMGILNVYYYDGPYHNNKLPLLVREEMQKIDMLYQEEFGE